LIWVQGKGHQYEVEGWRVAYGYWRALCPSEEIPEDARTSYEPIDYIPQYEKEQDETEMNRRKWAAEEATRKTAKEERRQHEGRRKRAEFRKSIGLQA